MSTRRADVAVIGLGSAGEALADSLAGAGRSVVGFEPGLIGGECPFTACMPSKSLLHDAAVGMAWEDARSHRDEVVEHHDDGGHARALEEAGVTIVRRAAEVVGVREVLAADQRWQVEHVVLATGSRPVIPPIDGIDDVVLLTSDELLVADELPASLLVLGGGAIGCEIATILAGFGRPVTVVESGALLSGTVDPAVADAVADRLREQGVDVRTGVEVVELEGDAGRVRARLDTGSWVDAAAMLVATGQAPAWAGLGLGAVGLDEEPAVDGDHRVAGLEWLHAIGDLDGRNPWTHGANHDARRLARVLLGLPAGPAVDHMASCVFTDPPVASIGLTTAAAVEQGIEVVTGTARYSDVARFSTDRLTDGVVVVVADARTGALLGCSGVGARFDDVISVVAALHHGGATVHDAADLVLPFPTIAQVLTPAFQRAADALP